VRDLLYLLSLKKEHFEDLRDLHKLSPIFYLVFPAYLAMHRDVSAELLWRALSRKISRSFRVNTVANSCNKAFTVVSKIAKETAFS
jgi:hypothetical protein